MQFVRIVSACIALMAMGLVSAAPAHEPPGWNHREGPSGRSESGWDKGYVLDSAIWPVRSIPVCWHADDTTFKHYAPQREIVRKAVANTWEAVSLVRFTGWGQCANGNNNGISIALVDDAVIDNEDDTPATRGLGTRMLQHHPNMYLNFEYTSWSSTACRHQADECSRKIAVHEFGHALGFAHEQNRPDKPASCIQSRQGTSGNVLIGPWDADSVMNYCAPLWNNGGVLSAGDIATVQNFYGRPPDDEDVLTLIMSIIIE